MVWSLSFVKGSKLKVLNNHKSAIVAVHFFFTRKAISSLLMRAGAVTRFQDSKSLGSYARAGDKCFDC